MLTKLTAITTLALCGATLGAIPARSAHHTSDSACAVIAMSKDGMDFYESKMYPRAGSPAKPGATVYVNDKLNVVEMRNGYVGYSLPLQGGTIAWIEQSQVALACGDEIPEPERWVFPELDM